MAFDITLASQNHPDLSNVVEPSKVWDGFCVSLNPDKDFELEIRRFGFWLWWHVASVSRG